MDTLKLWLKNLRDSASSRLDRWLGDNEAKSLINDSMVKPSGPDSKKP